MSGIYRWLISVLVWLSSDPVAIDHASPRAAAAVAVARASMAKDSPSPAPAPPGPTECGCGKTCVNGIWKPDGKIPQKCVCTCPRCTAARCPDGKCPITAR